MILNNHHRSTAKPVIRLVEPEIQITKRKGNDVTYTATYEVLRHCVLLGYADRREAQNIIKLFAGIPDLDITPLLKQYGVIKTINKDYLETIITDPETGETTTTSNATHEQITTELKNTVCVIIE